jgi:hypothetical protein
MKSEGTRVCGGKTTFKTSGQQVTIISPLSMIEAGQVVYSNPLFKKRIPKVYKRKNQRKEMLLRNNFPRMRSLTVYV